MSVMPVNTSRQSDGGGALQRAAGDGELFSSPPPASLAEDRGMVVLAKGAHRLIAHAGRCDADDDGLTMELSTTKRAVFYQGGTTMWADIVAEWKSITGDIHDADALRAMALEVLE